MKHRSVSVVTFVSLIGLLVLSNACLFGSNSESLSEGAIDIMKKIPSDTGIFIVMDVKTFRDDSDLSELYNNSSSSIEEILGDLNEYQDAVNTYSMVMLEENEESSGGMLYIIEGSFDLSIMESKLNDQDYSTSDYEGITIWEQQDEYYTLYIALLGKLFIIGDEDSVKRCIDVIKKGEASLYDNQDFRHIIDRLPSGSMMMFGTDEFSLFMGLEVEGLVVNGMSMAKKDSNTMNSTGIFKFTDSDAAANALDSIQSEIENDDDATNIHVAQDGEYINTTYEVSIESMAN